MSIAVGNRKFEKLNAEQVRRLDKIEAGQSSSRVLAKLIDDALDVIVGEIPDLPQSKIINLITDLAAKLTAAQGAAVADLGITTPLTALSPAAATQGATYDQTAINAALDAKADNVDAETLRTEVEARLDDIEAKVDAFLSSVRTGAIIAT